MSRKALAQDSIFFEIFVKKIKTKIRLKAQKGFLCVLQVDLSIQIVHVTVWVIYHDWAWLDLWKSNTDDNICCL